MVSSKDVARAAGVSQATVSRVMNNPESVKMKTREKVLRAMEELRYQPNLIARSLVMRSSRMIALISGSLRNDFFVETADAIVREANGRGYKTMVFFEEHSRLHDILSSIKGYKVDGILMSSIKLDDPLYEEIRNLGIPYIFFNRRPRLGGNYVVLDNRKAGAMLAKHLIEYGHEKIAYLSGTLDISTFYERKIGIEETLSEAGLSLRPEWTHFMERPNGAEIEQIVRRWMLAPEQPTAILCATDEMALHVMNALLSLGLNVPDDVSIAGIDDISISSHSAIQLTSVGQHKFKMGEISTIHLIRMIEDEEARKRPVRIVFQPELYVRGTTRRL
jgi:DNA-binding LacI/PurR family transcriptional regulator